MQYLKTDLCWNVCVRQSERFWTVESSPNSLSKINWVIGEEREPLENLLKHWSKDENLSSKWLSGCSLILEYIYTPRRPFKWDQKSFGLKYHQIKPRAEKLEADIQFTPASQRTETLKPPVVCLFYRGWAGWKANGLIDNKQKHCSHYCWKDISQSVMSQFVGKFLSQFHEITAEFQCLHVWWEAMRLWQPTLCWNSKGKDLWTVNMPEMIS